MGALQSQHSRRAFERHVLRYVTCLKTQQAAIFQFAGGDVPPTGRPTDGLKQWQRTTLRRLGLLPGSSSSSNVRGNESSSSSSSNAALPATHQQSAAVEAGVVSAEVAAASMGEPEDYCSAADSSSAVPPTEATPAEDPAAAAADGQPVLVWLGGDPPVSPELLAAVRVSLAAVRVTVAV